MQIVACENTMTNQKVTRAQILPGVTYVNAGVVEIMRRQQQGWAYLRP
jgi:intracellular sulfur oxidation DsrE/DsrF family protein